MFKKDHKQGEHVAIVGPTGSGKSVLLIALCEVIATRKGKDGRPARVVIFGTKTRDDTLTKLTARGWPVIKKWPPSYGQEHCIVWPKGGDPETKTARQRAVFRPLLNTIFHEGGQTLGLDEESDFERSQPDGFGLAGLMERYWTESRGNKVTLIAGTQRPRHVSRSMWSEPSWVFIYPPEDDDDLKRVAELSGAKQQVLELVDDLGGHEFLCVRRKRSEGVKKIYISKVGT